MQIASGGGGGRRASRMHCLFKAIEFNLASPPHLIVYPHKLGFKDVFNFFWNLSFEVIQLHMSKEV